MSTSSLRLALEVGMDWLCQHLQQLITDMSGRTFGILRGEALTLTTEEVRVIIPTWETRIQFPTREEIRHVQSSSVAVTLARPCLLITAIRRLLLITSLSRL